jgi:hypothetical protein
VKGKNPTFIFHGEEGNGYKKAPSVDSRLKNQQPDGEECEGRHY